MEIIGTTRYAVENPTFPPYVVPTQPLSSPLLLDNSTAAQILTLADENNLLKRDWAVVKGFLRGVSKNIRYALDLDFFESLQHTRYNYLKFLPQEYTTNLDTKHFPLDVKKIDELKAHYNRGWECDENLRRFPKLLNEEQASLQLDSVTINNNEKFIHYLRKLYCSGTFTDKAVIEWNNKPTAEQTYNNAIIFFEKKKDGMDKVFRLKGKKSWARMGSVVQTSQ